MLRVLRNSLPVLFIFLIFGLFWGVPGAQGATDDDFFEQNHAALTQGSRSGAYLGARDEQSLEVQTSLPQPSRSLDGTNLIAADDDDAPPATAPPTD